MPQRARPPYLKNVANRHRASGVCLRRPAVEQPVLFRLGVLYCLDTGHCRTLNAIALQLVKRALKVSIPANLLTDFTRHALIGREHQFKIEYASTCCARRRFGQHRPYLPVARLPEFEERVEELVVLVLPRILPVTHGPRIDQPPVKNDIREGCADGYLS